MFFPQSTFGISFFLLGCKAGLLQKASWERKVLASPRFPNRVRAGLKGKLATKVPTTLPKPGCQEGLKFPSRVPTGPKSRSLGCKAGRPRSFIIITVNMMMIIIIMIFFNPAKTCCLPTVQTSCFEKRSSRPSGQGFSRWSNRRPGACEFWVGFRASDGHEFCTYRLRLSAAWLLF